MAKEKDVLNIKADLTDKGIDIFLERRKFSIEYPTEIWQKTPLAVRQTLLENLAFGSTNFLPLILNKEKINYSIKQPLFESLFFKNQLFDLLYCEKCDKVKQLSYLKNFYNLTFNFEIKESAIPALNEIPVFENKTPTALIPFSFGKESLTTFALCRELGIKPILVYCQEPAHPYEEKYKLEKIKEFKKNFKVEIHYIKNEPGLFRYGTAFNAPFKSEVGWGAQTTILNLLVIPFVFFYRAKYILLGNESANNICDVVKGWKIYYSYDQTSFWTKQQNNMVRLLTNNQCQVKSTLEPLDEINIFYLLHHRYPEIGKNQFSCHAKYPLYKNSQWCHRCSKCSRIFSFTVALGINPEKLGFRKNLLKEKNLFQDYFSEYKDIDQDIDSDLDFAFYLLTRRKVESEYVKKFEKEKMKKLPKWEYYYNFATKLKKAENLPEEFKDKMHSIFKEELENLKKTISL